MSGPTSPSQSLRTSQRDSIDNSDKEKQQAATQQPSQQQGQLISLVAEDGEWKNRKITLMGVLRSFITQLKPGQDLTRVSLPAVLLYPYSMLEVFGLRELGSFDILCRLNREVESIRIHY